MALRVLQANKFFFLNGGSEAVMFKERDFLRGHGEVIDFSMKHERNLPSDHSGRFVETRDYGAGSPLARLASGLSMVHSPEAVSKFGALLDETRPDLVHCHNIYHQLTPGIIGAAKRRGVPVVLTLHDFKPVCPVYTRLRDGKPCSECADGAFSRVLKNRCADGSAFKSGLLFAEAVVQRWMGSYEQVDRFVAPSAFMRDAIAARAPLDRIAVLPNGVDVSAPPSTGDAGYILYFGRLSAEKGVGTLLRAAERSAFRWPVRVVGTGPLEAELRAAFPQARFDGHLSGEALREALRQAAVVVIPSEWYENCPMSVLEAMAAGKPVIASRIGGIPELVAHDETGLLVPAGDADALAQAMASLMEDAERRQRLGRAAYERARQRFSDERHNQGLLEIYNSVLQS